MKKLKNKSYMEKRRKKAWAKTLKRKDKQKAALKKSIDSKNKLNEAISQRMNQFSRLPDKCNLCSKGFDRTNREMINSWKVVVQGTDVSLYCPPCEKIVDFKIAEAKAETTPVDGEEDGQ